MPLDTKTPGSPGWWLDTLATRLGKRRNERLEVLKQYIDGDAPLPESAEGLRSAYRAFQKKARTNFASLVVEAVQERMVPSGFRVGADSELEEWASLVWSINELDAHSADVHADMLSFGDSYVIVGAPDEDGIPVITRESPEYVITAQDKLRPNRVEAALKQFYHEVDGMHYAYLYLPGRVYVAGKRAADGASDYSGSYGYEWIRYDKLPFDVVPVVRFSNRGELGEFEIHTDILDRINYMILQRLVIAALQAFRQRAIKGELPEVDAEGEAIDYSEVFRPGPGALWQLPEDIELWESGETNLQPLLTAVKDDIRDLAAVTRTPMSMLLPEGANQSAEGAAFAREGLVFKTRDRIRRATYGWNTVMQLSMLFAGRGEQRDIQTLWLPPEMLSLSERADATTKLSNIIPFRTLMTDVMQFPPEKAERLENERLADVLAMSLGQPEADTDGV